MELEDLLKRAQELRTDKESPSLADVPEGGLRLRYKPDKVWLMHVTHLFRSQIEEGVISDDALISDYERFEEYLRTTDYWRVSLSIEDRRDGDLLLDSLINYCRNALSIK